jgi:hypothetical protein
MMLSAMRRCLLPGLPLGVFEEVNIGAVVVEGGGA